MIITALVNLVVGLLIGWSSIAGFLLPIFFVGYLGLPVTSALALSFFDFGLSGAIGAINYHKKGNLNVKVSLILGIGSLIGALLGVKLNLLISQDTTKMLLYLVVFLSGVSILLRKDKEKNETELGKKTILDPVPAIIALGLITGTICSLSGAGGPILVMPLLVVLGMDIRTAIGVALCDSVFIAVPAFIGYITQVNISEILPLLIVCGISHSLGILIGSRSAHIIAQRPLKVTVAIFSIAISVYMISGMVF